MIKIFCHDQFFWGGKTPPKRVPNWRRDFRKYEGPSVHFVFGNYTCYCALRLDVTQDGSLRGQ